MSVDTCRICLVGPEPDNQLFTPCKCSGTMAFVHEDCLLTWQRQLRKSGCDVCRANIRVGPPPDYGWRTYIKYGRFLTTTYLQRNASRMAQRARLELFTAGWVLMLGLVTNLVVSGLLNPIHFSVPPKPIPTDSWLPAVDFWQVGQSFTYCLLKGWVEAGALLTLHAGASLALDAADDVEMQYSSSTAVKLVAVGREVKGTVELIFKSRRHWHQHLKQCGPSLLLGLTSTLMYLVGVALVSKCLGLPPLRTFPQLMAWCVPASPIMVKLMYTFDSYKLSLAEHYEDLSLAEVSGAWKALADLLVVPYVHGMILNYAGRGVFTKAPPKVFPGALVWLVGVLALGDMGPSTRSRSSKLVSGSGVFAMFWLYRHISRGLGGAEPLSLSSPAGQDWLWVALVATAFLILIGNGPSLAGLGGAVMPKGWDLPILFPVFRVGTELAKLAIGRVIGRVGYSVVSYFSLVAETSANQTNTKGQTNTVDQTNAARPDLLLSGSFLTLELLVIGCLALKSCGAEGWQKGWSKPLHHLRNTLFLTMLALVIVRFAVPSWALHLSWTGPDLVSRVITMMWPENWFTWANMALFLVTMAFFSVPLYWGLCELRSKLREVDAKMRKLVTKEFPTLLNYDASASNYEDVDWVKREDYKEEEEEESEDEDED